jgi:predicted anti-sigma-YlaC factor YlaD
VGGDYPHMTCEKIRVALSARLDGEDPPVPAAALDDHLVRCPGCRHWLARAQRVTRAVRVQAVDVPDLTVRILAAVSLAAVGAERTSGGRRQVLRWAVGLAAVLQVALAVPGLFDTAHSGREMGSFDVAMAVGFALAAWRPQRAAAFVPVALVLAGCLAITPTVDVLAGSTSLAHEIGHLVTVVQAGLLWALGRADSRRPGHPVARAVSA